MKYWKDGFYLKEIEGSVEITDEYWKELLLGQEQGKTIQSNDDGYPILVEHTETEEDILLVERSKCVAYLNSTDWIYAKCIEEGLVASEEYPDIVAERKAKRYRINEIDALLENVDIDSEVD